MSEGEKGEANVESVFFFWRKEGVLTTAYVSGYFDLFEVKKNPDLSVIL